MTTSSSQCDSFEDRLPARLVGAPPLVVTDTDGQRSWAIGDQLLNVASTAVLTATAGQGHQVERVANMCRAAEEASTRPEAMDVDCVTVLTIFPHCIGLCRRTLEVLGRQGNVGGLRSSVQRLRPRTARQHPIDLSPIGIVSLGNPCYPKTRSSSHAARSYS